MSRGAGGNPEHVNTPFYCGPTAPLYLISTDILPLFALWPLCWCRRDSAAPIPLYPPQQRSLEEGTKEDSELVRI